MKYKEDYNDYDKIEWVHSQLMELRDGNDADIDLMIEFIEDVREQYFDDANSVFVTLKEEWK